MKNLKKYIWIIPLFWLGGILFVSCEQTKDIEAVQALIKVKLEERIANYSKIKRERCMTKVLEEASRRADSILLIEARLGRDTFFKPSKPLKPGKPEILTLEDSTPVKPFLTLEGDTLLKRDSLQ